MRLITWNLGRHAPDTAQSRLMLERIAAEAPQVVCLTHAYASTPAPLGGHVISDTGASWGKEADGEVKVALVSQAPWSDVMKFGALSDTGAAVSGVTETDLGPIRFVGICTPHHFASPGGVLPRPPLWSLHISYVQALQPALKDIDRTHPVVVVGDFNQSLPLVWGDWAAHHALMKALHGFHVATEGAIPGANEPTTSHVALSRGLRPSRIRGLSRFDADGVAVSDHYGVAADIEPAGIAIFD
jgi:hypothetical protein